MRYLRNGVIRAAIPFAIMTAIALSLDDDPDQARGTFVTGIIIAAVAGFSVIYEVSRWSLRKQSLVHFGGMLAIVFPCLLLSGWFRVDGFVDVLRVFGIFMLVGVIAWGVFFLIFSRLTRA